MGQNEIGAELPHRPNRPEESSFIWWRLCPHSLEVHNRGTVCVLVSHQSYSVHVTVANKVGAENFSTYTSGASV